VGLKTDTETQRNYGNGRDGDNTKELKQPRETPFLSIRINFSLDRCTLNG
jgi:hypothetical protein